MTDLWTAARERILILDGAGGTQLQRAPLTEADFRLPGGLPSDLRGDLPGADSQRTYRENLDLLQLTRPDVVRAVHRAYFGAGADIASTNTFNSTAISQARYGTGALAYRMNLEGARLTREVADEFTARGGRRRWVAGSVGPTDRMVTRFPDVERSGLHSVSFEDLAAAYTEAIGGLLDGGADLLLIETVFDALNAKAALFAAQSVFGARGREWPVMLSATVDGAGRLLSGQTPQALAGSCGHAGLFSLGLNCVGLNGAGPEPLRSHLHSLAANTGALVSVHPSAGLPDAAGEYGETPEHFATVLADFARAGLVNIVGGCCGTTPEHIRALAEAVRDIPPRPAPPDAQMLNCCPPPP